MYFSLLLRVLILSMGKRATPFHQKNKPQAKFYAVEIRASAESLKLRQPQPIFIFKPTEIGQRS